MLNNLIGEDIKMMRFRYDEALQLQGIPCKYQYPLLASSNRQAETLVDSYSDEISTNIFFDGNPKVKTFKRYGWVVENDKNLPFLVHCSFNLVGMQRDAMFRIQGQYTDMPDRLFKVIEITYDMQAPDHLICQIVPVYDKHVAGRTPVEVKQTYNSSTHFLNNNTDYRGHYRDNSLKGD